MSDPHGFFHLMALMHRTGSGLVSPLGLHLTLPGSGQRLVLLAGRAGSVGWDCRMSRATLGAPACRHEDD